MPGLDWVRLPEYSSPLRKGGAGAACERVRTPSPFARKIGRDERGELTLLGALPCNYSMKRFASSQLQQPHLGKPHSQ
jgi:hypothetical protein